MTEVRKKWIREQARFRGIFDSAGPDGKGKDGRFARIIPLSSTPKYKECLEYMGQAYESGFDGSQTKRFEEELAAYMGLDYAVALTSGEAALRFALKLAAEKLYGTSGGIYAPYTHGSFAGGSLTGRKVFCSDLTTADMVNPIVFEGGEPVFMDCGEPDWCMDPEVLELAFQKYPEVRIVVLSEPYGFPGDVFRIWKVCYEHGALLIECAGDSFGAGYWVGPGEPGSVGGVWGRAGGLGDYCVLDFGRGKILGGRGGALLTGDFYSADKASYWAEGAKASTPWLQHEELGYDCVLGDGEAALLRGGLAHVEEIIAGKEEIYLRYRERLDGSLARVIPAGEGTKPNYWLTAMTCESSIRFHEVRNDRQYLYEDQHGTAAPMEIYEALEAFGAESRPVYKPMSMQPVYCGCEHFTLDGPWRMYENFRRDVFWTRCDRAREYYESGIVLPSDAGMTQEEQERVMEIVCACYDKADFDRAGWM